jgi:hypothetical protein
VHEERQHGDQAAHSAAQPSADREHVEENDAAKCRVPESETELVVRQQAQANGQRDDPEFQRRFLEERLRLGRAAFRREPVARLEDPVNRE